MYLPIHVGSSISQGAFPGVQRDDEGENISTKNPRYCELTALYWLWKNDNSDYKGIVHYRRYFSGSGEKGIATSEDLAELLKASPVLLPKKRHYYISTVEVHYADTFDRTHLDIIRKVLSKNDPKVLQAFDEHMGKRAAHIWNMVVMRSDIFDAWCSWLFPILEEVEFHINFDNMTPFEERVIGRLSERLLDPWLIANELSYIETPVVSMEKTNWKKKILSFLAAKFSGKKYEESF